MRALTLWQPWASLIALGHKVSETRSYAAPGALIGQRIAIHAGKRVPSNRELGICAQYRYSREDFPLGCIVCTVRIKDVKQVGSIDATGSAHGYRPAILDPEQALIQFGDGFGNYELGRYVWRLENMSRICNPIPIKGKQGFWRLPPSIADQLKDTP